MPISATRSRRALDSAWGHRSRSTSPGSCKPSLAYHHAGLLAAGSMAKFYFGGEWGMSARSRGVTFGLPPTKNALLAYLDMIGDTGIPWSVSVWGGDLLQTPVARLALELAGLPHRSRRALRPGPQADQRRIARRGRRMCIGRPTRRDCREQWSGRHLDRPDPSNARTQTGATLLGLPVVTPSRRRR